MSQRHITLIIAALALIPMNSYAQHEHHNHHNYSNSAPISIMGDHKHPKGEWMFSYRYIHMHMEDSRQGTNRLSAQTIAQNELNRFANVAGQPPTLRVVPTEMEMDMHMLGSMYAISDKITLMAMLPYVEKKMEHITFAGGAGANTLGTFTTSSEGFGDAKIGGLFHLKNFLAHDILLNTNLSIPTGSIDENARVLAPNGQTPILRMPYAMQLGTGTYDLHTALSYTSQRNAWNWGAQYKAEIRLEDENDEQYSWADKHSISGWAGYQWNPQLNTTLKLSASTQGSIEGIDPQIVAPVQTADPNNYGGDIIDIGFGLSYTPQKTLLEGHRFAIESVLPIYRDLNGPQLETDWSITFGWQRAF